MIKVVIVDDQKIIREGLKLILSLDDEIEIVGEGNDGLEGVSFCRDNDVDVVLMDIRMPNVNGVEGTKLIRELEKDINVLILTTFNEDEYILKSIKNGAKGYLLKDADPEEIINGVKQVSKGNMLIHSEIAMKMASLLSENKNEVDLRELTKREEDVAKLIGEGLNNKEIGEKLYLSEGTVKNYVTKILDKLDVKNRTELAIKLKN
ncbi:MAG: response regulator [Clostridium sp.]|uniref:response regulator n=1 Tax=Clostridium sp. TaxID=1506 RepID=UPI003EE5BA82